MLALKSGKELRRILCQHLREKESQQFFNALPSVDCDDELCVDEERRFFKYEVTPKIWTISQDIIVFFYLLSVFLSAHQYSGGR